jgi:hypothetical protein
VGHPWIRLDCGDIIDYSIAGDRGILVKRSQTDEIPPVASIAVWEVFWFRAAGEHNYTRMKYHTENSLTISIETGRMKLIKAQSS